MARPLQDLRAATNETEVVVVESWLGRSTARAFAAAISALLVATLVVDRSSQALTTDGTITGSAVSTGTISLLDDDEGRSLFDLSDVAPGRPVVRCIEVTYAGTILPVALAMKADAGGPLARYVDVSVDEGSGGGFETCDGFALDRPVYRGSLAELTADGWIGLGPMVNRGDRRSFRITFAIEDTADALGLSTNADFTWEVTPS